MQTNNPSPGVQDFAHYCSDIHGGERLLWVETADRPLVLEQHNCTARFQVPAHWGGMCWLRGGFRVLQGAATARPLAAAQWLKLQFFLDQAIDNGPPALHREPMVLLGEIGAGVWPPERAKAWYLQQAVLQSHPYRLFAGALRASESYSLIQFLSDSVTSGEKLRALAGRYGVSVSHFRRLCRSALGGTVKTGLREWRTARAMLAVIDGRCSLTEVALQSGYASSSHFSKEIKELLGVVPSRLVDITHLYSK